MMRVNNAKDRDKKKKKQDRRKSDLEGLIFSIMQKSLEEAMKAALDEVFKSWKI